MGQARAAENPTRQVTNPTGQELRNRPQLTYRFAITYFDTAATAHRSEQLCTTCGSCDSLCRRDQSATFELAFRWLRDAIVDFFLILCAFSHPLKAFRGWDLAVLSTGILAR
jgi:hypothetical protein